MPWSALFHTVILAAMATQHDSTWIEWNMAMSKVRQAASIFQHFNGMEMRTPGSGKVVSDAEYRKVMGE